MENTTASKKRKLCHDEEEDEDNEEEKMEKFFALVKSIREARARLLNGLGATKDTVNNGMMKRKLEEDKAVEVWKPTFQREDFLEEGQITKNPHASKAGSSQSKEGTEKFEKKEGLDLRLSL